MKNEEQKLNVSEKLLKLKDIIQNTDEPLFYKNNIYNFKKIINYNNISDLDIKKFFNEQIANDNINILRFIDTLLGLTLDKDNCYKYNEYAVKNLEDVYTNYYDDDLIDTILRSGFDSDVASMYYKDENIDEDEDEDEYEDKKHVGINEEEVETIVNGAINAYAIKSANKEDFREFTYSIADDLSCAAGASYGMKNIRNNEHWKDKMKIILKYGIDLFNQKLKKDEKINNKEINKEVELLKKDHSLIKDCKYLNNFSIGQWADIIINQPKLIEYCNKIDEFDDYYWVEILKHQPKLIDKCNKNLIPTAMIDLLIDQPSLSQKLIKKLNINNLKEKDLEKLIFNFKEYHIEFMEKYIEKYNNKDFLTDIIVKYLDLKEFYDKNDLWKDIDLSKAINNNKKLKEVYTKNDLWKYVDFTKLDKFNEYSILK